MRVKAAGFDFDGVLRQGSADFKRDAFAAQFAEDIAGGKGGIVFQELRERYAAEREKFDGARFSGFSFKGAKYDAKPQQVVAVHDAALMFYETTEGIPRQWQFEAFYKILFGSQPGKEMFPRWNVSYERRIAPAKNMGLMPDVLQLLQWLHSRKTVLFVASGVPDKSLLAELEKLDIKKFFLRVWGGSTLKEKAIAAFLGEFKLKPSEVLYVADAAFDIAAAKRNKVISVGVFSPTRPRELEKAKPDFAVKGLIEVRGVIERIEKKKK